MRYHFFSIPAMASDDAQQAFNSFCSQNRVLTVEKHFVADGINSFWSICVTVTAGEKLGAAAKRKPSIDYKEVLNA